MFTKRDFLLFAVVGVFSCAAGWFVGDVLAWALVDGACGCVEVVE